MWSLVLVPWMHLYMLVGEGKVHESGEGVIRNAGGYADWAGVVPVYAGGVERLKEIKGILYNVHTKLATDRLLFP